MCKNLIKTKTVGQFIDERMNCLSTSKSVDEENEQNTSFIRESVPFMLLCIQPDHSKAFSNIIPSEIRFLTYEFGEHIGFK